MFLSNKTDDQILNGLTEWVGKEREAASHVLHYLREVEERKLYLRDADSLFEFCISVHRYSRHKAQARIDAMRLMKIVPEIDQDIGSGKLSLTVAAYRPFGKKTCEERPVVSNRLRKTSRKTCSRIS